MKQEDFLERKLQKLIDDNTAQAIEINNLKDELEAKDFKVKTLLHDLRSEREISIVVRDCVLKFANESSLSGLIKVCADYLFHYYRPNLITFYISGSGNGVYNDNNPDAYSHTYDFKTNKNHSTTKSIQLDEIFRQMILSQQTIKTLSSYDLARLEETETIEAIMCKIQYSNKVIGFVLIEFTEELNTVKDNLINLLIEIFANNYSILLITNLLVEKYDNALTEAHYDVKTGIGNSRQLISDVSQLGNLPYCIVSMDVDDFKHVNDSYGHDAGDDALRFVGQTLDKYMQSLGGKGYREGGDEFIGIAPAPLEQAHQVVLQMLDEIANHLHTDVNGTKFSISNSAGLYERKANENFQTVKKKVDNLLYISKEKGKKVCTVDQSVGLTEIR